MNERPNNCSMPRVGVGIPFAPKSIASNIGWTKKKSRKKKKKRKLIDSETNDKRSSHVIVVNNKSPHSLEDYETPKLNTNNHTSGSINLSNIPSGYESNKIIQSNNDKQDIPQSKSLPIHLSNTKTKTKDMKDMNNLLSTYGGGFTLEQHKLSKQQHYEEVLQNCNPSSAYSPYDYDYDDDNTNNDADYDSNSTRGKINYDLEEIKDETEMNIDSAQPSSYLTLLQPDDEITMVGMAEIQVIEGQIEIFGFTLHGKNLKYKTTDVSKNITKSIQVFSPSWMSTLTIRNTQPSAASKIKVTSLPIMFHNRHIIPSSFSYNTNQKKKVQNFKASKQFSFQIMDKLYNQNRAFPITIPKSWSHVADVICSSLSNSTTTTTSKTTTAKTNDSVLPDSQINTPRSPTPPPIRVLICGATHVGKSTCLRYMVNRILNHQITQHSQHFKNSNKNNSNHGSTPQHQYDGVTMVLDCDVGQPEFSPPGMLSLTQVHEPLLSPPHMHMASGNSNGYGYTDTTKNEDSNDTTKPFFFNKSPMHLDSYFFGDTSSKSDPITYTNIISKLMNSYEQIIQSIKITTTTTHDEWSDEPIRSDQEEREEMYRSDNDTSSSQIPPLLVNTDGWVKGMGGEILSAIIDIVRPTHIIQIMGHSKAKCFELPRFTTIMNECEIFVIKTFARGQNQQIRIQPNFSETDHNNNNDSCNIDGDGDGNGSENSVKSDSNSQSSSPTKKLTKQRRLNYNINNECMPKIANNAAHAKSTDLRALRIYTYFMSGGVGGGANNDLLSLYDTATFAPPEVQFTHSGFIDPNGSIASTMGRLKPYAVSFDSVRYYIQAEEADIGDYLDVYEEESLILDGLNATIVGLCCCMNHYECGLDNDHDRNDSLVPNHQQLKEFHQHHNYIPRCLGLGIIRSIDRNRRLFYVLTPISLHTLQSVNLLIGGGKIPLPSEFLSKVGAGVCSSVPYQCYDDLMAGLLGSNAIKSRGHGEMA